jgi:raffinose/stachyose/melibiose transport system substrate-binding protein
MHLTTRERFLIRWNWKKKLKAISLVVVLAGGAWLLRPPGEDGDSAAATGERSSREAEYVIRFAPGASYFPGATPGGMHQPLEGMMQVIRAFEARFPDTRIEVVNVPQLREYLVTQLSSGDAPDVVNVNVEDVWIDTQKGWYIPLDRFLEEPNPFVAEQGDPDLPGARQWWDLFRYQAITRGKAAPDGMSYCLCLDMVETGIFYNKTLFDRLGLSPPADWEALLSVMQRLKEADLIPLLMNLSAFNDWMTDLFFDQLYYNLLPGIDLAQDPKREVYLEGYLDPEELAFLHRKGFFSRDDPRYAELWRQMRAVMPYVNRDIFSTDLTREFVTQRGAMLWSTSGFTYRLVADHGLEFEWDVFYLPPFTLRTSTYASETPMCVIGGAANQYEVTNTAVRDTDPDLPLAERMARSKRLDRVIAFLQFLSLPEQCEKVVNEYPCFLPNILGVEPLPVLEPFDRILQRRYTTTKWVYSFDLRFSDIQERMLGLYLTGGIELDEFLDWQVRNIAAASENLARRKTTDFEALEPAWRERAPARATFQGLPGMAGAGR